MRVLGVEIKGTDLQWIILDGSAMGGAIEKLDRSKIPLPELGPDTIDNLVALKNLLVSCMEPRRLDVVAIIGAQGGALGAKPIRAKIECMVELAAHTLSLPCKLVASQSVTAAIKGKFFKVTSKSFESAFGGGASVEPHYLDKAAYCAWIVLNDNR